MVELAASARRAGRRALLSGRWLADTVVEVAPRVPVRDAATLAAHHGGLTGPALADALVRSSGRVSAGIAGSTGGLIAAQHVSVAGLLLVPFELAAETVLVVLTELKLVTELHHVAGRPLPGGPLDRAGAVLMSWMSGRAAPARLAAAPASRGALGAGGRRQLRRELRSRFTRNLTTVAPMLTGAAAAGYLNRRATLRVGRRVARDLGLRR
ncbi:MAG TPA: hypothetical protein VFZ68_01750 [Acidimicrobiales bacterium]